MKVFKTLIFLFSIISLWSGEILLVDHDGNKTLQDGTPYDAIIRASLSRLGYIYKVWNHPDTLTCPPLDTLLNYKVVIWNIPCVEFDFRPKDIDSAVMCQYLRSGGKLFLISPEFIDWMFYFYAIPGFLGISNYENAALANRLAFGVSGAPYFSSFTFQFDNFSNNPGLNYWQNIMVLSTSQPLMRVNYHPYMISDSCIMLFRKFPLGQDTGRLVHLSVSFENIVPEVKRDSIVRKVLEGLLKYQRPQFPDLAISSIEGHEIIFDSILPIKSVNQYFKYEVKIKNLGTISSSLASITLTIKDFQNQSVFFSDTKQIQPLLSFDSTLIVFDSFTYVVPKKYVFELNINYSDLNNLNNFFRDTFKTLFVLFYDDFEDQNRTFSKWERGFEVTSERSYRGLRSFCEMANMNYPNMADIRTQNIHPISLKQFKTAILSFYVYYNIESGFDYCFLDISKDKIHYYTLKDFTGFHPYWEKVEVDLSGYTLYDSVYIRFRFKSDPGANFEGIFIDNLILTCDTQDLGKPLIIHRKKPDTFSFNRPISLIAEIYDKDGIQSAYLKYYTENNPSDTSSIPYDSFRLNKYYFTLPLVGTGERVYYFFEASDARGNKSFSKVFEIVQGKKFYNFQETQNPTLYFDFYGDPAVKIGDILMTGFVCNYDSIEMGSVMYMTYSDDANPIDTIYVYLLNNFPDTTPLLKFKDYPENNPQRRFSWNLFTFPQSVKFRLHDTFFIGLKNYRNIYGYPYFLIEDIVPSSNMSFIYKASEDTIYPLIDIISGHKADPLIMVIAKTYGALSEREKIYEGEKREGVKFVGPLPYLFISEAEKEKIVFILDSSGRKIKEIRVLPAKNIFVNLNQRNRGTYFLIIDKKTYKFIDLE
ncbi:MAG: hypothetical protein ABDH49_06720 [Candidatus Hydrothermales bacterium]